MSELQALDSTLPAVVMTAWGSVDKAVEAMRRGARDFIEKPWDNARLLATLRTQVELGRALRRTRRLEGENRLLRRDGRPRAHRRVGRDAAGAPAHRAGRAVGRQRAHHRRARHRQGSRGPVDPRRLAAGGRPLVAVNLGGLSEGLFESEMFGHVKGAFTDARTDRIGRFELAEGGTLLLDEIGTLEPRQQAKLLRVLETGEVERVGASRARKIDVRILSATNADIAAEVAAGRFREDLLFRLNTIEIRLPPLRERRDDIRPLAEHFLRALRRALPQAARRVRARGARGARGARLAGQRARARPYARARRAHGAGPAGPRQRTWASAAAGAAARLEDLPLEEVERVLIRKALERHGGNVSQAAKALGLSRSALYRRLQHHGL